MDLKKGSILEQDSLIDSEVKISENSTIHKSVIGKRSQIGKNVSIRNAIIGKNVQIGDGCQLLNCVIGDEVKIGKDIIIGQKCVLGDKVELLKENLKLEETWLISQKPPEDFSDDEDETDPGYGPKAILFKLEEVDDSDSEAEKVEGIDAKWGKIHDLDEVTEEISDDEDSDDDLDGLEDAIQNFEIDDDAKYKVFHGEVFESLQRGYKEGIKVDNLVLEVNSSRHAYAVTQTQVVQGVLTSILEIAQADNPENTSKLLSETKKCLEMFGELLLKYIKTAQSQADCLESLANFVQAEANFLPLVAKIVHFLYDADVLSDEAINEWFEDLEDEKVKKIMEPLIEWLEESESDDE